MMDENTQILNTSNHQDTVLVNDPTNLDTSLNNTENKLNGSANKENSIIIEQIDENGDDPQTEVNNAQSKKASKKQQPEDSNFVTRPCQLALSRIKTIMKLDPELNLASKDSVFLIAKATVRSLV